MTTNDISKAFLKQKEKIRLSNAEFFDIIVDAPSKGIKLNEEIIERIALPEISDKDDDFPIITIEKFRNKLKEILNKYNINICIKEIKELENNNNDREQHIKNILNLIKKIKNFRDKYEKHVGYKINFLPKEEVFENNEIKRNDYRFIILLIINI